MEICREDRIKQYIVTEQKKLEKNDILEKSCQFCIIHYFAKIIIIIKNLI